MKTLEEINKKLGKVIEGFTTFTQEELDEFKKYGSIRRQTPNHENWSYQFIFHVEGGQDLSTETFTLHGYEQVFNEENRFGRPPVEIRRLENAFTFHA